MTRNSKSVGLLLATAAAALLATGCSSLCGSCDEVSPKCGDSCEPSSCKGGCKAKSCESKCDTGCSK